MAELAPTTSEKAATEMPYRRNADAARLTPGYCVTSAAPESTGQD
jgi:hypothetical protein